MKKVAYRYRFHWWRFKKDVKKFPNEFSLWIYSEQKLKLSPHIEEQILYIDEESIDELTSSQHNP